MILKDEELKAEDVPEDARDVERIHRLNLTLDPLLFKGRTKPGISSEGFHKEWGKFFEGDKLTLTELRMALREHCDLYRWTVYTEEDKKKHDELTTRILKFIKEKVVKKEYS